MIKLTPLLLAVLMIVACKKNSQAPTPPLVAGGCMIASYTTNWTGTYGNYNSYQFDNNNKMVSYESIFTNNNIKITRADLDNAQDSSVSTIAYQQLYLSFTPDTSILTTEYHFNALGYPQTLPSGSQLNFTTIHNGVATTTPHYEDYLFTWDNKGRLIKVEETSPRIGDYEWTLNVTYNDKNNVTSLKYDLSTGPRDNITIIAVSAYDDKPNPYSTIPYWKFILPQRWNNSEPEPLIVALSQNNPLDLNYNNITSRTMSYTYNEKGFPLTKTYTNKNIQTGATTTFNESYSYTCK